MTEPARDMLTALGKAVERQRKRRGLAMARVAEVAEVCCRTVYRVESGEDMRLSTLLSIAQAVGCSLEITIRRVPETENTQDIAYPVDTPTHPSQT